MWTTNFQMVAVCLFLQMPVCFPSVLIRGSVAHCGLSSLSRIPPLPPNITHLFLKVNRIREISATSLSGLEQLQELNLEHQLVPLVIRNNAFSKQKHLRRLVLSNNKHLHLEPLAFAGLSGLETLHLDYCSLNESILTDRFLEPLTSLQTLDLFGNNIKTLQPSVFFKNITKLTNLNLTLNNIDKICESDLVGFKGKDFTAFNLSSVRLQAMLDNRFDWEKCGNPFRGMSFQFLDLSRSGLSLNKLKLFFRAIEGTKISHLKLSGHVGRPIFFDNLPDPDRSTYEGLKNSSVLSLDLTNNYIFALHQGVFSALTEIAAIDLSHNRVNQIHKNAFEGLQGSLKTLNLSHNLLGKISSDTFDFLTNLEILDLSHNHVGILGYASFRGLPNLKSLKLNDNSLQQLGSPAALPRLDHLTLDDNRLTASSVNSITRFARNAVSLSVQNNRLTNLGDVFTFLSEMKHLQKLFSGGNAFSWCALSSRLKPSNVTVLDLHSSSLQSVWAQRQCLNMFYSFGNVTSLNLSKNALSSLPQGIFEGLTSVVEMDLSSNSLTYIEPDDLPRSLKILNLSDNFIASPDPAAFHSLSHLDLSMNRFCCDADLRSFLTWMKHTNVTFLSPIKLLKCEFPSGLRNRPLLAYSAQVRQQ